MRYSVLNINQAKAMEYGLDIIYIALIDWFSKFLLSGRMESKIVDGETYYWVSYPKVEEDMPILGLKDRQIAKRFRDLCDKGIFISMVCPTAFGKKTFLRLKSGVYSDLYENNRAKYVKTDMAPKEEVAKYAESDMGKYAETYLHTTNVVIDKTLNDKCITAPSPQSQVLGDKLGSANEGLSPLKNEADERAAERVISLPLNNGSEYWVTRKQIDDWQELYPAVNVTQQLRSIKGWCIANPNRRKTRNGVNRFINNWLCKEQDNSGRNYQKASNNNWRFEGKTSNAGFIGVESGEIEL